MPCSTKITYLNHSGFAVGTRDVLLIFDDAQGKSSKGDSIANGHITKELIASYPRTIFFVSHSHADHFSPDIYDFTGEDMVYYVLGEDLPPQYKGFRMARGERLSLCGAEISTYDSTDEGVSYLVKVDGWTFFHAGDLNLWHWREQSTLKEIEQAEREYEQAVAPLFSQAIDFAFFPVDPRMGELYDAGAVHFLMHVKPRVFIPMHWWGRADVALEFARKNRSKRSEIMALTKSGEAISAEKKDSGEIVITQLSHR